MSQVQAPLAVLFSFYQFTIYSTRESHIPAAREAAQDLRQVKRIMDFRTALLYNIYMTFKGGITG
jgi:hypothetical protein